MSKIGALFLMLVGVLPAACKSKSIDKKVEISPNSSVPGEASAKAITNENTETTEPNNATAGKPTAVPANAKKLEMGASVSFDTDMEDYQTPVVLDVKGKTFIVQTQCDSNDECELLATTGGQRQELLSFMVSRAYSGDLAYTRTDSSLVFAYRNSGGSGAEGEIIAASLRFNDAGVSVVDKLLNVTMMDMPEGFCVMDSQCGDDGTCFVMVEKLRESYCHGPEGDGEGEEE